MTGRSEIEDSVDALMFAIEEASAVQTKHGAADPSAEDEKSAVLAHVDALLDELRRVEGEREAVRERLKYEIITAKNMEAEGWTIAPSVVAETMAELLSLLDEATP